MVNLNSDESLKVPVNDIKKRQIMEKRELVNQAITVYYRNGEHELEDKNIVRATVISLFNELGAYIRDAYGMDRYKKLKDLIYAQAIKIKDLEEAYNQLDDIVAQIIDINREPLL
jgi:hypothetical protein